MLAVGLQAHQVDDVDHPDLQLGQLAREDRRGGDGLERRHVPGAGEHHVGLCAFVAARPVPDADPARAVRDRLLHRQVVERGLLAGDDHVDVVAAAQAVVGDRQQAVGVRGQVHADDLGLLVDHVVDEPGVLVGEAVVVLAPHVRGEQVVQRRDRPPPGDVAGHLQPLGVLVEHRVDDVDERLVAVEQPVAAGQQVALQPALAEVLGQDLHHPPVGREVIVASRASAPPRRDRSTSNTAPQAVGRRLVGAHDPEAVGVAPDHVAQERPEHARRLARCSAPGAGTSTA